MKAIFWKEIRENWKWGALGMIVFSLALASAWASVLDPDGRRESVRLLLHTSILGTMPLCMILAGALGFLQIMPEQKRDRWAFLMHRPASWSSIFWGKTLAGLVLYFTATLAPWAVFAWRVSMPGSVAGPFDWRLGLAGLADVLCCSAFYFAGLICALRKARWVGSKLLAVLSAGWILRVVTSALTFERACAWMIFGTVLLLIAARANFLSNGETNSQGRIARWALTALFSLGMGLLVHDSADFANNLIQGQSDFQTYRRYLLTTDGEVVIANSENGVLRKIEDAAGKDMHADKDDLGSFESVYTVPLGMWKDHEWSYRSYAKYFLEGGPSRGEHWFYRRGTKWVEFYDEVSRRLSGYLTPDGFQDASAGPPASQFPGVAHMQNAGSLAHVLCFGKQVYQLNYTQHLVRPLARISNESDYLGGDMISSPERDTSLVKSVLVAALADGLHYFDPKSGAPLFQVPYREGMDPSGIRVAVSAAPTHYIVWYGSPYWEKAWEGDTGKTEYVYRYSADGKLDKEWTLPPLKTPAGRSWLVWSRALPVPLWSQLYDATEVWMGKQTGEVELSAKWKVLYDRNWGRTRDDWMISALAGILCMVVAFAITRTHVVKAGELAGWMVFLFFLGLPGLLVFLAMKEWPARVVCKACGEKRTVSLDLCEHCGAGSGKARPRRHRDFRACDTHVRAAFEKIKN